LCATTDRRPPRSIGSVHSTHSAHPPRVTRQRRWLERHPDALARRLSGLQRLDAEANAARADAGMRKKADAAGLPLRGGTATDFTAFITSETRQRQQRIEAANISTEQAGRVAPQRRRGWFRHRWSRTA